MKKVGDYDHERKIILMSNNAPDTMTKQPRYHEKYREQCIKNGEQYYEKNKERLRIMARDRCGGLSEEDKNIEREYARNKHQNVSAKDKQKLNERKKKNICSIS